MGHPREGVLEQLQMPSFVYRLYDEQDELLYIGLTGDVRTRLRRHAQTQPWWSAVRRITIETFDNTETAALAEKQAIRREHPRYNIADTGRSPQRRKLQVVDGADPLSLAAAFGWAVQQAGDFIRLTAPNGTVVAATVGSDIKGEVRNAARAMRLREARPSTQWRRVASRRGSGRAVVAPAVVERGSGPSGRTPS